MKPSLDEGMGQQEQPVYVLLKCRKVGGFRNSQREDFLFPLYVRQEDIMFQDKTAGEERCEWWERQGPPRKG